MFSAIRRWFARSPKPACKANRRVVLGIELLEDRAVPASFVVNTLEDNPTQPPPPIPQRLSLRQAILQANASGDPTNNITFQWGMGGVIELDTTLPPIAANMNINGTGAAITIRRDGGGDYRIFTVQGGVQFDLSNLSVKNGKANNGGGILVPSGATANLYQVTLWDNHADINGGGIFNEGTLTLENSTLYLNSAAQDGGGIHNNGSLHLQFDSIIWANQAERDGGGIHNGLAGTAVITDSTIRYNSAGTAAANQGSGGGIFNTGTLQMSDCVLWDNRAIRRGGGLFCAGAAISVATLDSVSMINNHAHNAVGNNGLGGGFYFQGVGSLTMSNCTLSGNVADDPITRGGFVEVESFNLFTWTGPDPDDPIHFEEI
ncbi:MAG: hypothetical protein L0Y72_31365 [Gemmataceae bacterium]|nr:hypothetical protein [Gemmataceae bacterium]MCI0743551.1 hypothetical protein [Gemmataceae bacterium]